MSHISAGDTETPFVKDNPLYGTHRNIPVTGGRAEILLAKISDFGKSGSFSAIVDSAA